MELPDNIISRIKERLNTANKFCVAILTTALILDVWVGVLDRYLFQWQLVWVEELARYIMIWAILMAVPCCTAGREHMGLTFITQRFPNLLQQIIKLSIGTLTCVFFFYITYLGYAFTLKGANQVSTVFALPMSYAYAAVPVTFFLSGIQASFVLLEDIYAFKLITSVKSTPLQEPTS